jgi:hypothetical protein
MLYEIVIGAVAFLFIFVLVPTFLWICILLGAIAYEVRDEE